MVRAILSETPHVPYNEMGLKYTSEGARGGQGWRGEGCVCVGVSGRRYPTLDPRPGVEDEEGSVLFIFTRGKALSDC